MEYCQYGCLRDFLVSKRNDFIDTMDDKAKVRSGSKRRHDSVARRRQLSMTDSLPWHSYNNDNCVGNDISADASIVVNEDDDDVSNTQPLITKDLVCYSFQIARGMEFLASKKVYL